VPISVACTSCSAKLNAPDQAAGKRVKCPKCQSVIAVPAPVDDFEVLDDEPEPKKPVRKVVDEEDDDRPARKRSRRDDDDEDDDDRPRSRKKKGKKAAKSSALPLLLIIAGTLAAAAVGWTVIAFVLNNRKDEVRGTTGPAVPRGDTQPNADWEVFDRPEFGIQLPRGGQPPERNTQGEGRFKAQFPDAQVWTKTGPTGTAYVIAVCPLTGPVKDAFTQNRDQAVRLFGENMLAGIPPNNVESNTEVQVGGASGRQAVIRVGPGKNVMRIFFGTDRLILLNVTGPIQSAEDPQAKPFFDSFKPK
jgi:hypothetical protein